MRGKKGTIWRAFSIVMILALLVGVLPVVPSAQAAPGDSPGEAILAWTSGQPAAVIPGNVPPAGQTWYKVLFTDNTQQVGISLTSVGDTTFDYYLSSSPDSLGSALGTNVKSYCIPSQSSTSLVKWIKVRSVAGGPYTLNVNPGSCAGSGPGPSPSPVSGNGSTRDSAFLLWSSGQASTDNRTLSATPFYYRVDYSSNTKSLKISLTSPGDAVFDYMFGTSMTPGPADIGLKDRFIPCGSIVESKWIVVRGSPGANYSITVTPTECSGGFPGQGGGAPAGAVALAPGQTLDAVFTAPEKWFSFNYQTPFQPAKFTLTVKNGPPNLKMDIYYNSSTAYFGQCHPEGTDMVFDLQAPNTGTYYIAVRPGGYIGTDPINFSIRATESTFSGGGQPQGSQFNPITLLTEVPASGTLSGQNWYNYVIPAGKKVQISVTQGDPGVALNIMGGDQRPIAAGVRNWTTPPFFTQPSVLINMGGPAGGSYTILATAADMVDGDGTSRDKALPLPMEVSVPGRLSPAGVQRLWYVYQHNGPDTRLMLMDPSRNNAPSTAARMDIFSKDSTVPMGGSPNSGYLGSGVPTGPVYILVQYAPNSSGNVDFALQATTQLNAGGPGEGGKPGAFQQDPTKLTAHVMDCVSFTDSMTNHIVPNGRISIFYNGNFLTTLTTGITGTISVLPSTLPNGGTDGHYDLQALPPVTLPAAGQPGANCAPGQRMGVDIRFGLVSPPGDATYGQPVRLGTIQLTGSVKDPAGAVVAKAQVKAIPDFGGGPQFGGFFPGGDSSATVKTNTDGTYSIGGLQPGIPYNIVAVPPEPADGGPGAYAQSTPTKMRFNGSGFSFGGAFGPPPGGYTGGGYGGYQGGPPPGGYTGGGYGGYQGGPPPGGYTGGGYGGYKAGTSTLSGRNVAAADDPQVVNLELTSPNVSGTVKDPSSGAAVAGARVVANEAMAGGFGPSMGPQSSSVAIEAFTGADGKYNLGAMSSGKVYDIVANPPANSALKASKPNRVSFSGTAQTGVDLTLSTAQVTVKVAAAGAGISNANVAINSMNAFGPGVFFQEVTDSSGNVTFGGLADGQYNIMVFPDPNSTMAPPAPQMVKISGGTASPATVTFNLGAASMTGIVYQSTPDSSGNYTPVTGGVHVQIYKPDFTFNYGVNVNQQGAFAAGGMPDGAYKIQAKVDRMMSTGGTSPDSDSIARDVIITNGKPDAAWEADSKLILTKPQVTVFVLDPNNSPTTMPVHIQPFLKSGASDTEGTPVGDGTETNPSTGQALLGGLSAGSYLIKVFMPPMLPYANLDPKPVTISAAGTADTSTVSFTLAEPVKRITGTVKRLDGTAVTNAGVHAFREDGSGNSDTSVDSTGTYTVKLSKGGTWLLVLFPMFGGPGGGDMGGGKKGASEQGPGGLDWIFTEAPHRVELAEDQAVETKTDNFTVGKAGATVTGKVAIEGSSAAPDPQTIFVDVRDEKGIGNGAPVSSSDGSFTVAVPAGITARVRVFSKDPSLSQKADPPVVEPKEKAPVDVGTITMARLSTSITGQVVISGATDASGNPVGVTDIEINAFKEGGMGFARTTSSTGGVFTLPVGAGVWRVAARPGKDSTYAFKGRAQEVTVTDQSVSNVILQVQAADAVITASLGGAAGASQLYGFGFATDKNNNLVAGTPMERGSFKLRVPKGVTYTVSVNFPPGLEFGATPVIADLTSSTAATVTVPVSLAANTIVGSWVDDTGAVLTGKNIEGTVFGNSSKGHKSTAIDSDGNYSLRVVDGTWFLGGKVNTSGYIVKAPANNQVTVSGGQNGQTKILPASQNFVLQQASGVITGTVKAPNGDGLVARVWAETKPATSTESPQLVADTVSTSDGSYSLNVPAGTYVIRTAVPPERGYLPPLPVQATVTNNGTVTVNFQFTTATVTISGTVTGSGAASALVSAYSDNGAWSSVTAGATGTYSLNATTNDTWHIVASSSISSTVYRSDQVNAAVLTASVTGIDLALKEATGLSLPAGSSMTFDATSMQVLALEDGTQVTIPSGALATSGNVTVYVIPTEKLASQPSAQARAIGYNLKAFDSNNVEIKKFQQSVTLKVPYPADATLTSMGIDETMLKPSYYDTVSGSWVTPDTYTQDTSSNTFTVTTDHFTIFAGILSSGAQTVASASSKIYVPFLSRQFSPSSGW